MRGYGMNIGYMRGGRKISPVVAIGVFFGLLFSGCFDKPPDPVAPRWDVGLTAPISAKSYTLEDLVNKDTSILQIGSRNQIIYKANGLSTASAVGDLFSLAPQTATTRARLGPISIGMFAPLTLPIPVPGLTAGQPLPPLVRASLPATGITITQFESVTIKSGTLYATIRNNLPVAVTIDSVITIRDDGGAILLPLSFPDPRIPPGGSQTISTDLAGRTVPKRVTIANVSISEPGGGTVPSGDLLTATLTSTNVVATSVVLSSIPPQILMDNSTFSMPFQDSSKVREVGIRSGTLTLNVRSAVDLNMLFKARFPQLLRTSGEVYVDSFYLARGAVATRTIPLNGLRLKSTTGGFIDRLEATTTADLYEGSAGRPVTVSENDSVRVFVSTTTISVDTVVGVVKPTSFAVNERVPLHLGEAASRFRGQMVIPSARLALIPLPGFTFPLQLNLAVKGRNAKGNEVVLAVPVTKLGIPPAPIVFAPADVGNFLTQISGKLPDTLQLAGTVTLNPDYDTTHVGAVGSRSTFGGSVDFSVPLTLSIVGGAFEDTVAFGDTTGDGNSEYALNADLLNDINFGKVHFDVTNDLPLGVSVTLTLLDKGRNPLLTLPQTAGDALSVLPATVLAGEAVAPSLSTRLIQLSGDEVRLFGKSKYVRYGLALATPGTGTVTFRSDQFIRFRVWSELSYQVNR
jgi:hypothetical protein